MNDFYKEQKPESGPSINEYFRSQAKLLAIDIRVLTALVGSKALSQHESKLVAKARDALEVAKGHLWAATAEKHEPEPLTKESEK